MTGLIREYERNTIARIRQTACPKVEELPVPATVTRLQEKFVANEEANKDLIKRAKGLGYNLQTYANHCGGPRRAKAITTEGQKAQTAFERAQQLRMQALRELVAATKLASIGLKGDDLRRVIVKFVEKVEAI